MAGLEDIVPRHLCTLLKDQDAIGEYTTILANLFAMDQLPAIVVEGLLATLLDDTGRHQILSIFKNKFHELKLHLLEI